jgi:hypothetical protein
VSDLGLIFEPLVGMVMFYPSVLFFDFNINIPGEHPPSPIDHNSDFEVVRIAEARVNLTLAKNYPA